MNKEETHVLLINAMGLLLDRNLEWSADFSNIRPALCVLLHEALLTDTPNENVLNLAEKLIDNHG